MATIEELLAMLERKPAADPDAPAINPPAGQKGISFEMDPADIPGSVQVQKQPLTTISAPQLKILPPSNDPIEVVEEQPVTALGEFDRVNQNKKISDNMAMTNKRGLQQEQAFKGLSAADRLELMAIKEQSARSKEDIVIPERPKGADAEMAALRSDYDKMNQPQEQDMTTALINSLGPALLAIGFGGGGNASAAQGGVSSFAQGQKNQEAETKMRAEERKARILGSGKRLEGAAALRKAENDAYNADIKSDLDIRKLKDDRVNKLNDMIEKRKAKGQGFTEALIRSEDDLQKLESGSRNEGITSVVGTEDKALDRASREKVAALSAQAAAARQRNSFAQRPPTESQTNSANAYTMLKQADDNLARLKKEGGGKLPSDMSDFFDTQKSFFESNQPKAIDDFLRLAPNEKIRQQIQIELQFTNAKLRRDSGAAISPSEFIRESSYLFGRKADNDATKAAKDASRKQVIENYRVGAGRAPIPAIQQPVTPPAMSREDKLKRLQELETP